MSERPTTDEASRALQSLLAAAAFTPTSQGQPSPAHTDMSTPAAVPTHNDMARRRRQQQTTTSSLSGPSASNIVPHGTTGDGDGDDNLMNALNSMSTSTLVNSHSHTMALLANQPSLFPGLTLAPPSPAAKSRHMNSNGPSLHHGLHGNVSEYRPQPTRSGRVPQKPDPKARREADRETMLFNDYFDWPSDDDEDEDPDFQPHAPWSDLVVDPGTGNLSNEDDDEGNDSDLSDSFTPAQQQQMHDHIIIGSDIAIGSSPFPDLGATSNSEYPFANAEFEHSSPRRRSNRIASSPLGGTSIGSSPKHASSRKPSSTSGMVGDQRKARQTLPTVTEHSTSENAWPLDDLTVLNNFLATRGTSTTTTAQPRQTGSSASHSSTMTNGPLRASPSQANLLTLPTHSSTASIPSKNPIGPGAFPGESAVKKRSTSTVPTKRSASVAVHNSNGIDSDEISFDASGKRIRGRCKKYLDMTRQEQVEMRKERNREHARQARLKKKEQQNEHDRHVKRLEEENIWLRERCKVLEDRLGEEHLSYESEADKEAQRQDGGRHSRRLSWSATSVADSMEDDEDDEQHARPGQQVPRHDRENAPSGSSESAHGEVARDPLALLATSATAAATGGTEQINSLLDMSNVAPEALEGLRRVLLSLADRAQTMISAPSRA
ncbi:hypothetical protein OIV83_003128 [Microbotryomycetes sp. JL201]|nr:hypothetical protein OIV83_003128 [Microbotryomycetes sp. JL201]